MTGKEYTFEHPAGYVWRDADRQLGVTLDADVSLTQEIETHIHYLQDRAWEQRDMIDTTGVKFAVDELNEMTLERLADLLSALTGLPFVRKDMQKAAADANT